MKCHAESDLLLTSCSRIGSLCDHKFCQNCFRKENIRLTNSTNPALKCPCCQTHFYGCMRSIDEAVLLGEAATFSTHISPTLLSESNTIIPRAEVISINGVNMKALEKLESALHLNPINPNSLYLLFRVCKYGKSFLSKHKKVYTPPTDFYGLKVYEYSFKLLDHPTVSDGHTFVQCVCCDELSRLFWAYYNYPSSLTYAKLAYEHCLRSSNRQNLTGFKDSYLESKAAFDKLPPLRFAIGNEVEFLHELETGGEWKLGKVVELYYRERDFDITFTAPYRLVANKESEPPVYICVKADTDRYVRKVGVRSIEDTRYQARLDAKVEELARVYCSQEFIEDVHRSLAQDRGFVEMLQSVWRLSLSSFLVLMYRMLVMYRQPLVRTDSGYHVPLTEEVIAGIKAYFDPALLSPRNTAPSAAAGEDSFSEQIRTDIIRIFQGNPRGVIDVSDDNNVQAFLLNGISAIMPLGLPRLDSITAYAGLSGLSGDFTVPSWLSDAISKATSAHDLRHLHSGGTGSMKLENFLLTWVSVHAFLEKAGPACECPFVYFFVKSCVEQHLGAPKLALDLHDRMNMQLSREFIRCANPTCELNKLDHSTGKVKFKQCSRCKAVIYCSRECQIAHYPEHKRLCREHSTG